MNSCAKVALVTGAGTGIGRDPLEATVRETKELGSQTLVVPTDVRDPSSVRLLFTQAEEVFGRLDLLFNNAGTAAPSTLLEDLTCEECKSVVDTNLTGAFLCTQEAFKLMKSQAPQGGRIINNGSISSHSPRPNSAPYTAAKHAEGMQFGVPQANGSVEAEPTIDPQQVARAVVYMASLPLDANVLFLTVMATKMPFVGRG